MVTTQLNPMQLNVLSLMSYIDTEQEQQELQDILLQFYRMKTDNLLRQFQQEKGITQETLDEWSNQHEREPVALLRSFFHFSANGLFQQDFLFPNKTSFL